MGHPSCQQAVQQCRKASCTLAWNLNITTSLHSVTSSSSVESSVSDVTSSSSVEISVHYIFGLSESSRMRMTSSPSCGCIAADMLWLCKPLDPLQSTARISTYLLPHHHSILTKPHISHCKGHYGFASSGFAGVRDLSVRPWVAHRMHCPNVIENVKQIATP